MNIRPAQKSFGLLIVMVLLQRRRSVTCARIATPVVPRAANPFSLNARGLVELARKRGFGVVLIATPEKKNGAIGSAPGPRAGRHPKPCAAADSESRTA